MKRNGMVLSGSNRGANGFCPRLVGNTVNVSLFKIPTEGDATGGTSRHEGALDTI